MSSRGYRESADRRYFYRAWHQWEPGPRLVFIDVVPGKLDRGDLDREWIDYSWQVRHGTREVSKVHAYEETARRLGCSGWEALFLFGLRYMAPEHLVSARDPVGPGADAALELVLGVAREPLARLVAVWGRWGGLLGRAAAVESRVAVVANLWALGVGPSGAPLGLLEARGRSELVLYRPKRSSLSEVRRRA